MEFDIEVDLSRWCALLNPAVAKYRLEQP